MSDDEITPSPENKVSRYKKVFVHGKEKRNRLRFSNSSNTSKDSNETLGSRSIAGDLEVKTEWFQNENNGMMYRKNADRFAQERLAMEADFSDKDHHYLSKTKAAAIPLTLSQSFQTCAQLLAHDEAHHHGEEFDLSFKATTSRDGSNLLIKNEDALRASLQIEAETNEFTESALFEICAEEDELQKESKLENIESCDSVKLLASDEMPQTEFFARNDSMFFENSEKPTDENEIVLDDNCKSPVSEHNKTPRRNSISIVDKILEDFLSSPGSTKSDDLQSIDLTPYFRFRNCRNLRTYANKTRPRRLLESETESDPNSLRIETIAEQYHSHNPSSESEDALSIDSESTIHEIGNINSSERDDDGSVENLNNSQKMHENLMNLSSFFTQTLDPVEISASNMKRRRLSSMSSTNNPSSDDDNDVRPRKRKRSNSLPSECSNSSLQLQEDFLGFPSGDEDHENTAKNCSDDSNSLENSEFNTQIEVLPTVQIPCNPVSSYQNRDDDMPVKKIVAEQDVFSKEEDLEALFKESQPFSQFQLYPNKLKDMENEPVVGFQTASHKTIKVSEEAKCKAANMLQELPNLPTKAEKRTLNQNASSDHELPQIETVIKKTVGFGTASGKSIQISDVAKRKAAALLNDLPDLLIGEVEDPPTSSSTSKVPNKSTASTMTKKDLSVNNCSEFVGFKTASVKEIKISDAAKRKALSLFANLPELSEEITDSKDSTLKYNKAHSDIENKSQFKQEEIDEAYSSKSFKNQEQYKACSSADYVSTPGRKYEINNKRKLSDLYNEKTTIATKIVSNRSTPVSELQIDFENSSQSSRTPLSGYGTSCRYKTITRNLSLTMRKDKPLSDLEESQSAMKSKRIGEHKPDTLSPLKSIDKININNNNNNNQFFDTPNSKDFFRKSMSTSTPHQAFNSNLNSKPPQHCVDSSMDADFQQIQWDNEHEPSKTHANDSVNCLGNTSQTLKPPPPSPQERVERLCQFGPAPTISPIIIRNNGSRSIGLSRRSRSARPKK